MENGKSPGIDGLPIEFYKDFFQILKDDLQNLYNNTISNQKYPQNMESSLDNLNTRKR